MLQDREVAIDQFIKITSGGVKIADYDQVQAALVKRYKEVYGSDIDLSNTTADGVFVNDLALIINNILQSFKVLYSNLDADTASGVYLDNLCRLSNVSRKLATRSTAQLRITSTENTTLNSGTIFVDRTGNEWTYEGETLEIYSASEEAVQIKVVCNTFGAVEAPSGSIYQTLESSYLEVDQVVDAVVGREDESDADLRARRAQSTGSTGTTVLESLLGALLELDGIEDVQIINNNTDDDDTAEDGTEIKAHSIYVILRQEENLEIAPSTIGQIIYNKLTPGIKTNQCTSSSAEDGHYVSVLNENITWLNQDVYWKKPTPIHPTCSVTIKPLTFFDYTTEGHSGTDTIVGDTVMKYLNSIKLSKTPVKNDMIVSAIYADPQFKGAATYIVESVTLPTGTNPNTYYNYTTYSMSTSQDGDITITFA